MYFFPLSKTYAGTLISTSSSHRINQQLGYDDCKLSNVVPSICRFSLSSIQTVVILVRKLLLFNAPLRLFLFKKRNLFRGIFSGEFFPPHTNFPHRVEYLGKKEFFRGKIPLKFPFFLFGLGEYFQFHPGPKRNFFP